MRTARCERARGGSPCCLGGTRCAGSHFGRRRPHFGAPGHAFHVLPGATNCLCVRDVQGGTHTCSGAGAGQWPTAESVMADLWDLWRGARADAACEEVCDAA